MAERGSDGSQDLQSLLLNAAECLVNLSHQHVRCKILDGKDEPVTEGGGSVGQSGVNSRLVSVGSISVDIK